MCQCPEFPGTVIEQRLAVMSHCCKMLNYSAGEMNVFVPAVPRSCNQSDCTWLGVPGQCTVIVERNCRWMLAVFITVYLDSQEVV